MSREKEIVEFRKRQSRQIFAVAAAIFLVLLVAVVHKRPDIFGEYPSRTLFEVQAVIVAAFIGYSAVNWRCPACNKYLGSDIHRTRCNKCGIRFRQ